MESRCFVEGERVLATKHIVLAGIKCREARSTQVVVLCLRTAGIHDSPHTVEAVFSSEAPTSSTPLKIVRSSCSCAAGLSEKCKHITALLLHCYNVGLSSLSDLSCTDVECAWKVKKVARQMYEAVPLHQLCHVTSEMTCPVPSSTLSHFSSLLRRACPESAIEQHRKRIRSVAPGAQAGELPSQDDRSSAPLPLLQYLAQPHVTELPTQVLHSQFKDQTAVEQVEGVMREEDKSVEWHAYRRGMVTASVAHNFMTRCVSLLKGPRPVNLNPLIDIVLRTNRILTKEMKNGIKTQGATERAYVGYMHTQGHEAHVKMVGLVIDRNSPYIGCSPDGVVTFTCNCCKGKEVLLEIKCLVKVENSFANFETRKIKREYVTQINVQMGVCGASKAHFFVFVSSASFHLEKVLFDEVSFNFFCGPVGKVYEKYMLKELYHRVCAQRQ